MKKIVLSLLLLLVCVESFAQLVTPFTVRTQFSQKGGIRFISNAAISCVGGCAGTAQVPPAGTAQNNNFTAAYIDIDGDGSTFQSSSDSLDLPTCSEISWAGLYWSGISNAGQANYANRFSVRLKVNNGSYQTITALPADCQDNTTGYTSYHAFADITSIVQAAGTDARYTIANQFAETGGMNKWGGWTIVVVYKNDLQPMRNLTVFNGLATVTGGFPTVDVPISGFLTPLSGPVTFDLGVVAYDGDRSQTGDQLLFNGGSGFVNVSDAIHALNDVFNSTISYNGVLTPFRLPSLSNTLGQDANIFLPNNAAKNYIGNSATSATIRVTTGGETILTHVVTSAIDIYEPDLRAAVSVQDLNGGLVEPGDVLEYSILSKNIGSDPSVNTFVTDTIEGNAQFVPGSIQVFYGPNAGVKTDAASDDQAEYNAATRTVKVRIGTGANAVSGGMVVNSPAGVDSTIVKFRVTASTDCIYLQCDNIINNRAYIFGTGNVSGNTFNNGSNPGIFDGNGCPIPGTTSSPINSALCVTPAASSNSPVCGGGIGTILLSSPASPSAVYAWTGPNGFTSSVSSPVINNATAAMAGLYTANITIPGLSCAFAPTTTVVISSCTPPVANDDTGSALTEDGANGTVQIVTNDTDADGNPTVPTNGVGQFTIDLDPGTAGVQLTATNASGTWTYNPATGVVTFDPANNFNGSGTLTYEICDPQAFCDQAVITFPVTSANDAPVANDDNGASVAEDGANGTVNILTNDTDIDGNPTAPTNGVGQFTVDLDPGTAGIQTTFTDATGTWTYNTATGVVTFDPANNYNGTATIPYQLCDPVASCDPANITFVVTPVNDAPVANDDNGASVAEDGANGTVNILTNDTDPEGNPTAPTNGGGQFTVDLDPGTAGIQTTFTDATGTWTYNTATGVVTFDPANNYNGTATIPYQLCDPAALCDGANITFVVTPVNDGPVANDDNGASVAEDGANGTVNILTNDTDIDGNPTAPTNGVGQFTVDLDPGTAGIQTTFTDATGTWTYNTATGVVTFDPATNYNGTATIPYQLCDPAASCDPANITFVVTPVNDAPVANDDNGASVVEDGANGTVNILTNDTDPEGNPTAPTNGGGQFTVDLDPGTAGIQTTFTDATGTWTYNTATGVVTFDPATNYNGTATIPYQLCDPAALCDGANITFVVTPVNDGPVVDNENHTISEDTPATGDLTDGGDSDLDGNLDVTTTPVNGPDNGTILINPDGTYTYTPNANFNGNDTIVVQICDDGTPLPAICMNDTIFITVTPVNDGPIVDNENHTISEDTPATGDLTDGGDSDLDGNLVVTTTPVNGPDNGTILINPDGTYTYTPNANFNGNDTIVVQICDDGAPLPAICVNDTIFITVTPVNDGPVVDNENHTISEDTPATGDLTNGGDSDLDGNLVVTTTPLNGPDNGTILINPDGTYTYTPNANFNGNDTIVVQICDDGAPLPAICVNDTIFITVTPVNDGPVVDNENHTISEDTPATGDLTNGGDSDLDGNLVVTTTPVNGPDNGTILINPDGTYTYTPNANYNGNDTIVVQICDDGTPLPAICVNDTIFITVTPVNDGPVVDNENHTISEDTPATGDLTNGDDSDLDGNLVVTTTPVNGPDNGTILINPDGTYTYTPNTNYNGNDTIVVQICDDGTPLPAICVNDTIFITVTPVNDPPVIDDEMITTNEDTPVSGDLTDGGDSDPDGNLVVTTTPVNGPDNGTILINPDGTYTYTPNTNFNGNDTIVVQICDDGSPLPVICTTDTIFVTVTAVNDGPVVDNENHTIGEDTPATGDLTNGGDSDLDGNLVVTTTPVNGPDHGTILINPDGTYTYTPNTNYNGNDMIVVQICDDGAPLPAICINDTIFITVIPANDPPVVDNENHTTNEDTPVDGDLTDTGDSDPDGNLVVTTTPVDGPDNGTILINPDGTYTYTPNANFNGNDTIVVQICDDGSLLPVMCTTDTIFIAVTPVNDPPVLDNEHIVTNEDNPVSGDLTDGGDTDTDGNLVVTTTPVDGPDHGTITINPDGTYTYTPDNGYVGSDTVIVTICDDGAPLPTNCSTDTIFITIDPCTLADANADCDDDGVTNGDEVTNGTNPSNPDTDGDGVTDGDEVADGTDANDPCDLVMASVTVTPDTAWLTNDCDNDGLTNNEELTGTDDPATPENPDSETTDPFDPDTDGDGVTDGDEAGDGTDPNDPCDYVAASATLTPEAAWNALDCDGDGTTNGQETTDGTDPQNPCDLVVANQDATPDAAWMNGDCDNDGLTNGEETTGTDDPSTPENPNGNVTDPLDPDTDGDGVTDGDEAIDGTDPNDPCDYTAASVTLTPEAAWNTADCDGDGVTNGQETTDGTNPQDPCDLIVANQDTTPGTAWTAADCDNDGLTNEEEATGNDDPSTPENPNGQVTDPLDPDTDGDGVTDGTEAADGTNPNDPCDLVVANVTLTPDVSWNDLDCDNDGISNGDEVTNGSDPLNPCSPKPCGIDVPEAFTPDGDGHNDTFVIEGVETFPNNEITIFNRWGNVVYQAVNYQNDWDGTSNSDLNVDGNELPTGTYYYVFDTNDETQGVLKGYVYIQR